ncbi:MAG: TlpA disulfide reductase family protein [Alphaproteobacteria bacterium]
MILGGVAFAAGLAYAVASLLPSSGVSAAVGNPSFIEKGAKSHNLNEFKGKPLIINLWASWCGYCVAELPSLDALAVKMRKQGGDVLTILLEPEVGRGFLAFKDKDIQHLKLYHDDKGEIAKAFCAAGGGLPLTIFLNAEGKEVFRYRGKVDWDGEEAAAKVREHLGLTVE